MDDMLLDRVRHSSPQTIGKATFRAIEKLGEENPEAFIRFVALLRDEIEASFAIEDSVYDMTRDLDKPTSYEINRFSKHFGPALMELYGPNWRERVDKDPWSAMSAAILKAGPLDDE